jgi:hypothetical protein
MLIWLLRATGSILKSLRWTNNLGQEIADYTCDGSAFMRRSLLLRAARPSGKKD